MANQYQYILYEQMPVTAPYAVQHMVHLYFELPAMHLIRPVVHRRQDYAMCGRLQNVTFDISSKNSVNYRLAIF